jgi:regulatory protein
MPRDGELWSAAPGRLPRGARSVSRGDDPPDPPGESEGGSLDPSRSRRGTRGKKSGSAFEGDLKGGADEWEATVQAPREDPEARARELCLRLLTLAPRTRAQLADALRKRGIPDETAGEVLGRFAEVGLIDDAAFARAWVESRHYSRGLSGRALSAELRRRGVAAQDIRSAIDEQLDPDAEASTARLLVDRKLNATRGLPPEQRARRLAGMLARKGYPAGLAFRVIREALEAEGEQALPEEEQPFGEDDQGASDSSDGEW